MSEDEREWKMARYLWRGVHCWIGTVEAFQEEPEWTPDEAVAMRSWARDVLDLARRLNDER